MLTSSSSDDWFFLDQAIIETFQCISAPLVFSAGGLLREPRTRLCVPFFPRGLTRGPDRSFSHACVASRSGVLRGNTQNKNPNRYRA